MHEYNRQRNRTKNKNCVDIFQAGDFSVGTGYISVTVAVAPQAVSLMIDDDPVTSPLLRLKLVKASKSQNVLTLKSFCQAHKLKKLIYTCFNHSRTRADRRRSIAWPRLLDQVLFSNGTLELLNSRWPL